MSIKLYVGPMFSGKTSELSKEFMRWKSINASILLLNHTLDTRYSKDSISTHDKSQIKCIFTDNLEDFMDATEDVIIIDEGQFHKNLISMCNYWANSGKNVIVGALNCDSNKKPFGEIDQLYKHCDEVIKLNALCIKCKNGTRAIFTFNEDKSEQIKVGSEDYLPLCRIHWNKGMLFQTNSTIGD